METPPWLLSVHQMCVLCPPDSDFKGYSWNFYLYYGKEDYDVDDPCASNLCFGKHCGAYYG